MSKIEERLAKVRAAQARSRNRVTSRRVVNVKAKLYKQERERAYNAEVDKHPSPMDIDSDGMTEEQATGKQLSAVFDSMKESFKRETKSLDDVGDADYYVCVVFVTGKQKRAFLDAMGWTEAADDTLSYVDGVQVAMEKGIPIPEARLHFSVNRPLDKKLAALPSVKPLPRKKE